MLACSHSFPSANWIQQLSRKTLGVGFFLLCTALTGLAQILVLPPPPRNPVPLINQPLVPDSATPGAPAAFTLTVNGSGFVAASVVKWNGSSRTTTFVSNIKLTTVINAADVAVAGTASVTVFNPATVVTPPIDGGTSNVIFFTITNPTLSVSFANISSPATGTGPVSVAVGDFNGDGKPDLAVANFGIGTVSILLGNVDGTFSSPLCSGIPCTPPATGANPISVAVGDFNGDGKLDLAVVNNGSANLTVLLGIGDGTFTPAASPTTGFHPYSVAVGDFNGDGKLDLAVANEGSANLTILLGNGDGTFTPAASPATGSGPISVAVGDFNGDGKLDLAVANYFSANLTILLGNGDGTFSPPLCSGIPCAPPATGASPFSVAVGDFNGDGKLDLAVTNDGSGNVTILKGDGAGNFTPLASPATGVNPRSVVVGDFNGDGNLDLAVANTCCNYLTILLGDGKGNFTAIASPPATGFNPISVAVGDFNGDGRLDLAVANYGSSTVSILLQVPIVSLSTILPFANQNTLGVISALQTVTLTNTGSAPLTIVSIVPTGDFAVANNTCPVSPASVPGGAICTFDVTFTPTAHGTRTGSITLTDNANPITQFIALSGTAVSSALPVTSVSSLSFGQTADGTTSPPKTVTLTNNGTGPMGSISITVPPGFLETDNCGTTLAVGASCTITITADPKAPGAQGGSLTITSDAASSPQTVLLTDVGTVAGASQIITTFAGGGPNNVPATSANLNYPVAVVKDNLGNLYIVAEEANRVYKVDASGVLTVAAGNGTPGFSGDGGPATSASLAFPRGIAVDASRNLFIVDNQRIRRVDASTGVINTVAGGGSPTFPSIGDGGPATSASLNFPTGIAVDAAGNLFIADSSNERVRRVDHLSGIITTVAGGGTPLTGIGDGGPATSASLSTPYGVAVDGSGNLFIADTYNQRIREVAAGVINTVAGGGSPTFPSIGDGGPATSASLLYPFGVAVDASGNLFIADTNNQRIREVAAGVINTVAGGGSPTFPSIGDGGPATSASLLYPLGVAVDSSGNLFIADTNSQRIREVAAGVITTVAGNGFPLFGGDGSPATNASLNAPEELTLDGSGNLFISDTRNNRIRRVDAITGIIATVAGGGTPPVYPSTNIGDGGPATSASLNLGSNSAGVAVDGSGNLFIADTNNRRIREVAALTGIITTVAGGALCCALGDNGPATSAYLSRPEGVAVDGAGNLFIADSNNRLIRRVNALTHFITTVAGGGPCCALGDGGLATSAYLNQPASVTVDGAGNLFITDSDRIRRVDALTGNILTVAGGGSPVFPDIGDGGPATSASLNFSGSSCECTIGDVVVYGAGNLYIADTGHNRIRRVDAATGIITTMAGNGVAGFSGDGGLATSASLNGPDGVAVNGSGTFFIADTANNRIRRVGSPLVNLSSTNLSFGAQLLGTSSAALPVTLSNLGGAPLTISSSLAVTGDFTETDTCPISPATLAIGSNCTISVTFTPTALGARTGTVSVTDNAAASPQTITLSGTGVIPAASLSASSLTFSSQLVGTTSAGQTVTLTNPGSATLNITSIVPSGDFAITGSTCGATLLVSANCTFGVTFTPTATGAHTGAITLTDDASPATQTITLNGTGIIPIASLSASSFTFSNQRVSTTSAAQMVTLTNSGTATLNITSIAPSGDFAITGSTCGATLLVSANCTFGVTFTPTATGARTGAITLTDDASPATQTITLNGTGIIPIASLSASSFTFSNQRVSTTSAAQMVTLTNSGTATLNITSVVPSGDFAITGSTCGATLLATANCTFGVTFTPTATGARAGAITLTDNASPATQTITLNGTGVIPIASLSASSFTFSSQLVGTTSAAQMVTLTNSGTATLNITSVVPSGDFAITGSTCGATLLATANCTFGVTFTPTATGARTGAITLTDNASPATQTITLSGAGVIPIASLSAPSLTFPNQIVSTTSAAQTVTLTNTGTFPLAITGIVPSGDFTVTNTCGGSVTPTANCALSVRFTPTATGLRTGSITLTDNASPSLQTITLSGTGTASAQVTVSATSLQLPDTHVNQKCTPRSVTLTNSGAAPLTIAGIAISGQFTQTNSCPVGPATLAPGASCLITVTFGPTTTGAQTGTLTINSNAPSTSNTVALAGNGKLPCLLVPAVQALTVIRGADTAIFSLKHQTDGGAAEDPLRMYCTNQAPASCAFNPGLLGPMGVSTLTLGNLKAVNSAALMFDVHGDAALDKHTTGLTVLISDFTFVSAPDTATIAAGQTTSFALVAAPQNGLEGTLTFDCSGAPAGATCTVSPRTVNLAGSAPASMTVTVSTTARSLAPPQSTWRVLPLPPGGNPMGLVVLAMLAMLAISGLLAGVAASRLGASNAQKSHALSTVSSMRLRLAGCGAGLTMAMVLAWGACGGGGSFSGPPSSTMNATPAGTYNLTVTGTYTGASGTNAQLSHSTTLKLTVN